MCMLYIILFLAVCYIFHYIGSNKKDLQMNGDMYFSTDHQVPVNNQKADTEMAG